MIWLHFCCESDTRDPSVDLDWGGINQQEERWSASCRNKGTLSTSAHKEPEANMVKSFYFWQQCYLAALFWGHGPVQRVRGLAKRENWCGALGWSYIPCWTRFMAAFPEDLLRNQKCDRELITKLIQYICSQYSYWLQWVKGHRNHSAHSHNLSKDYARQSNFQIHTRGCANTPVLLCASLSLHSSTGTTLLTRVVWGNVLRHSSLF